MIDSLTDIFAITFLKSSEAFTPKESYVVNATTHSRDMFICQINEFLCNKSTLHIHIRTINYIYIEFLARRTSRDSLHYDEASVPTYMLC